jgi:outer membrane receptor protein involved in Fe transport
LKSIFTLFLLFSGLFAHAQQQKPSAIIAGNLVDASSEKVLPGATVSLQKISDSSKAQMQVSDEDGGFLFEQLDFGYYSLQVKMSGYASLRIDSIHVREERVDFNLSDIKLSRSVDDLESVTVYAEKPLIENKDGKIIFNASESALSNASTATELLKQTPLVSTDNDGKMLMKGKEVKILIDDKPVEMDARQLQDLLESMPGSMIEKIEVLTTPPAEYANERGGVINIVTKKGKVGKSGRINLNYGTRGEAGISGSYNYRKNKIALNLTAGYTYNKYKGTSYSIRENFYADSSNFFKTDGSNINSNNRPNARLNFDYSFNKFQSLSTTLHVNSRSADADADTWYSNINQYDVLYRLSDRAVGTETKALNPSANISYLKKGKTSGRNLRVTASFAYSETDNLRDFYQQFLNVDSSFNGTDSSQRQQTISSSWNKTLRINYDMPLKDKKTILNFGGNAAYYTLNNTLITSFLKEPDNVFEKSDLLSNDFDFFQTVYSLRAALRYSFKKDFFFNLGMQQEFTKTHFDIRGDERHYPNEYWSSLPFANITRKWENGYSLTASYKRSIQRPGINNLNPSVDYSDPYNTRFGNPFLQPYFSDNFDLGTGYWKKKFNINFSVGYNSLQDIYTSLRSLDTSGKTFTSWYNLSGRKEYEASIFGGINIGKKLKLNASANYTYNVYSEYDQTVRGYHNGSSINSSLNGNYTFSPVMNFTGNLAFNRFANPQGTVRNRVSVNLGVQRKFLQKKLIVSLNLVDPFSQQQNANFIETPRYNLETFSQSRSRNLRIAIAYNFSKKPKKKINASKKAALDKLKAPK